MSPFALSALKWGLLLLLYLFVWRSVRSIAADLREPTTTRGKKGAARKSPARKPKGSRKPPVSIAVRDENGKKIATHRLVGTLEIGREETSPIRLDDQYVSQQHARFLERNGSWYVEDLGSTNGTYLNEERVTEAIQVHAGDVVRVGKITMELKG